MTATTDFYDALAVWSDVAGAIAFVVVIVYIFNRFVQPAVIKAEENKNAELADADARRAKAKAQIDIVRAELAQADVTAGGIRERAERDATADRERILAEAKAEGERQVRNAGGELERGRLAARDRLRARILERALEIARESAAKTIDARTNGTLVRAAMDAIGGDGAATRPADR